MGTTDDQTRTGDPAVGSTTGHRLLGGTGVLIAAGALYAAGGVPGGGLGLGLAVAWSLLSAPWLVALAHVGVLVSVTTDPGVAFLVPFELGLVLVLAGDAGGVGSLTRSTGVALTAVLLLGGIAWAAMAATGQLPIAALALVVAGTTLVYLVHRLELLRVGKLGSGPNAGEESPEPPEGHGSNEEVTGP